ncbi:MAG: universal stress protein [Bacteroidales bacterium]
MNSANHSVFMVSTDFTEVSDYALEHAAVLARQFSAKILLIHVIDKHTRKMLRREKQNDDYITGKLSGLAREAAEKHQLEIIPIIKKGKVCQLIADTAKEHSVLFHFMGTHGKNGLQHITGSFALRVIKRCPCPVIVVQRPAGNITFKKIVFPLDLQPGSRQKVKWAKILHQKAGSHFDIFVENYGDKDTDHKLNADRRQVVDILEHNQVPNTASCSSPNGSFAKHIVKFAREKDADAIMITSDPDRLTCNPFNKEEERVLYNREKIPVMFINSRNLNLIIGGP